MTLILGGARRKILPQSKKGFKVQTLFMNGEAGAVYDPSDLTPEKVAWRRNLLTWSEDFTNAAWDKNGGTTVSTGFVSPTGDMSAQKIIPALSGTTNGIARSGIVPLGGAFSFSAKAAEITSLTGQTGAGDVFTVNLTTGAFSGTTATRYLNAQVINVGNGWWRVSWTRGSGNDPNVFINAASGIGGSNGFLLWGMQTENNPTATAYQRITDFTSDFLAAFPTHTLFQDSAGTTPVTALGQPVGLVLDTSRGGLANLGPELVPDAGFDSASAWTAQNSDWVVSGGRATYTKSGVSVVFLESNANISLAAGKCYDVRYTISGMASGTAIFSLFDKAASVNLFGAYIDHASNGSYVRRIFVASAVTGIRIYGNNGGSAASWSLDGFSVREVPGVHAIQPTSASRPLLDARVNLLTFSEQFDNADWTAKTNVTVTANATIAPDGTTTADRVVDTATNDIHRIFRSITSLGALGIYSLYMKADTASWAQISLYNGSATFFANFNLTTGAIGTTFATAGSVVASIISAGNGWYRCIIEPSLSVGGGNVQITLTNNQNSGGHNPSYAGTGTGVFIWGADLRLATDAAYPYQRVAAATDYADVGAPRSFLFDGVDDGLYTASNMDLSGTNKVTVLAGVRKLSDAAVGGALVAEFSPTLSSNNGTFWLAAPVSTGTANFDFRSKGTAVGAASYTNALVAAPTTRVATGIGDISGDSALLRIDGSQVASDTADQGTGTYGNFVLFIGRRNNASLPFNGKLHQLIVRGAATDAGTLVQAERYVAQRTGITL